MTAAVPEIPIFGLVTTPRTLRYRPKDEMAARRSPALRAFAAESTLSELWSGARDERPLNPAAGCKNVSPTTAIHLIADNHDMSLPKQGLTHLDPRPDFCFLCGDRPQVCQGHLLERINAYHVLS